MNILDTQTSAHQAQARTRSVPDLRRRIQAEFREMPGLRLTVAQAARFFHLDQAECERILGDLVRSGDLRNDGRAFSTAGLGR